MAGVIFLIVVMLVLGPIGLFAGGAAWSALLGALLNADPADASEPVDG